jgi:hypothetical protein
MQFNSLTAGTGGITMATAAGSVFINNSLTCANLGAGQGVFSNKLANIMNLRSIKAGPGLVVTGSASEITVGADPNITGLAADNAVAPAGACETWTASTPAGSAARLTTMWPTQARWIVAGVSAGLSYSDDGLTTKTAATTTSGALTGLYISAYNGTALARQYFQASFLNEVWSSPNGAVWTQIASGQKSCWDLAWDSNSWVAAVEDAGLGIQRSADGVSWSSSTTSRDPTWVIPLGGPRLACGGANGQLYSSDGGATWVAASHHPGRVGLG